MLCRLFAGLIFCLTFTFLMPSHAGAQELLQNRSFEMPVAPALGNNFYASIPNWTMHNLTVATPTPFNIVRPHSGYSSTPKTTVDGAQYLDVYGSSGSVRQTITLPSAGMIDISGWFSLRDVQRALTGLNVNIRATNGTLIAQASTSFLVTEPLGLWKQAALTNIPLAAGSYIFEVDINDVSNADQLSAVFKPALTITKTVVPYSDPANGTINPKNIPDSISEFTISVTSPSSYSVTSGSVMIIDPTPANTDLVVADIDGAGSGPVAFDAGSSGMTYMFSGLGDTNDDVDFSNDNGLSWTYAPTPNENGVDPAVTRIRLRPGQSMAASSTITFRLRYRIR